MIPGISALWASDGSSFSRDVAPAVEHLLSGLGSLTVLTVAPMSGPDLVKLPPSSDSADERSAQLLRSAEAAEDTARSISLPDVSISTSTRWGSAAQEIVAEADEGDFDLVVLAMKPHSTLRRMVLGDTAVAVLQGTRSSVLLARPIGSPPGPLLVLCQDSLATTRVIDAVQSIWKAPQTRVVLAAFLPPQEPKTSMFVSYRELLNWREEISRMPHDDVLDEVSRASAALAERGFRVDIELRDGDFQQGLRKLTEEIRPSCVVVSDQHSNTPRNAALTSVVDLGTHLPCSVLVARSG